MFKLSGKSDGKLDGVDGRLAAVIRLALTYSEIDYGVNEGRRAFERQKKLFKSGESHTMDSKHLDGLAVDLYAWVNGKADYSIEHYDKIAEAIRRAAIELEVPVRWGACWNIGDIREWEGTMQEARLLYIELREAQGKTPFVDAVHFEMA